MAGDSHAVLIDELHRHREALKAFVDACKGCGLPTLWRLGWVEALLHDLADHQVVEDSDPDASFEARMHAKRMCELLRQALAKAEPLIGTTEAEAHTIPDPTPPAAPGNDIPF